jgi:hypothetical protein
MEEPVLRRLQNAPHPQLRVLRIAFQRACLLMDVMHCSTASAMHGKQLLVQAYPTAQASCAMLLLLLLLSTAALLKYQCPAAICQFFWPSCTAAAATLLFRSNSRHM